MIQMTSATPYALKQPKYESQIKRLTEPPNAERLRNSMAIRTSLINATQAKIAAPLFSSYIQHKQKNEKIEDENEKVPHTQILIYENVRKTAPEDADIARKSI